MAQLSFIEQEYQKYVELPGVNFSMLKLHLRCPLLQHFESEKWKDKQRRILDNEFVKEGDAFKVGKALHNLVLQPDIFNKYPTILYSYRK